METYLIYRYEGFLADQTGDTNDSAMRSGIMSTFGPMPGDIKLLLYERDGYLYRCPVGNSAATNKWNSTRDQLIPYVAGLDRVGARLTARRLFYRHASRLFFAANFERDIPGTTKYPWPHYIDYGDPKDFGWRWFDFADPLMPHHIGHLVLAGRMWWLYWLLPLAWLFLFSSIVFCSSRLDAEQNQIQSLVKVYGKIWVWLYKAFNFSWRDQTEYYWLERGEYEYAQSILENL